MTWPTVTLAQPLVVNGNIRATGDLRTRVANTGGGDVYTRHINMGPAGFAYFNDSDGTAYARLGATGSPGLDFTIAVGDFVSNTFFAMQADVATGDVTFGFNVTVSGAVYLTSDITPTGLGSGTSNDYAPVDATTSAPLSSARHVRQNVTGVGSSRGLSGLIATSDGHEVLLTNITTSGLNSLVLTHEDTGSSAANRFALPNATNITLLRNDSVLLRYDGVSSRWRVVCISRQATSLTAATQVDVFTANGTWNKPSGARFVEVFCLGAGGGGASGPKRGAGNNFGAGSGGGGAGPRKRFQASELGASESVTVGTGGTGGAAQTAANTAGNSGNVGGNSSFGSWLTGYGGGGGASNAGTSSGGGGGGGAISAGGNGTASAGGSAGRCGGVAGTNGGTAGINSTSEVGGGGGAGANSNAGGQKGGDAMQGGPGGGGGGANLSVQPGGAGGDCPVAAGGAAGAAAVGTGNGGTGGAGTSPTLLNAGSGGGGGGSATSGNGGDGGAGGRGAGGGAGGATSTGTQSGAGGNGGDGLVVVVTYF